MVQKGLRSRDPGFRHLRVRGSAKRRPSGFRFGIRRYFHDAAVFGSVNLRVRDFRFQRCREAGCDDLQSDAFKQLLRGKNLAELRDLVDAQGALLNTNSKSIPGLNSTLAKSVFRSALKTLLVTQLVWGDKVAEIS